MLANILTLTREIFHHVSFFGWLSTFMSIFSIINIYEVFLIFFIFITSQKMDNFIPHDT